jgi:hypothetical protein
MSADKQATTATWVRTPISNRKTQMAAEMILVVRS